MSGKFTVDVAVVGAGPAGLAAAVEAVEAGASVAVVDAGQQPGGQFWRHRPEQDGVEPDGQGHHDWSVFLELRRRFSAARASGRITYLAGRQVWMASRDEDGYVLRTTDTVASAEGGPGETVRASRLVLCPGGYDRQLPVPGWELPGVMAAGGVQAFLKANGALPGRRFVVAGTGPFLLPVAANIAEAGGQVLAVLESSSLSGWLPQWRAALGVPGKALEGAEYAAVFARHRIPYKTRRIVTSIEGERGVESVRWARVDGQGRAIPGSGGQYDDVDVVGFGWGFTPQMELPLALGVATRVDADGSLVAVVDEQQESSVPGLYLAGEVTGVGGAVLAVLEGRAAGAAAAGAVVLSSQDTARRDRHRRFAQAMHRAHPVPEAWQEWLTPETLVCRCEEVTVEQVSEARTGLGADDSRSLKSFTRAGMGWCQGRVCGFAASCLGAGPGRDASADSLASSAKRPLAVPVPLGELALLDTPGD
ncbi:NAD(P)/FAD-dependent oxidoreductase [Arthrobacter sp. NPDC090010]|uniref:FAD/NAD(P)-dependent oxidoreductase n=1 Tax=Arthrobacter sp. NPDC090010 TaxID=3363942 RepID=UPI0037F2BDD9